jgi:hypothetical protein
MDEAGLGPNYGPFVVALTVWDVPYPAKKCDFWNSFSDVLTNSPEEDDSRLHIADSKQLFQPHKGYGALERGVLSALRLLDIQPRTYDDLLDFVCPTADARGCCAQSPWYDGPNCRVPAESHDFSIVDAWKQSCQQNKIQLKAIKAAIVEPQQFNRMLDAYDNKSLLVSRVAFQLLRSVWNPDDGDTFIIGDKHGGRNRYDLLLSEVLDGEMIFRVKESADRSDYRVGKTVLRFEPRAEAHGPVALASMTAKYIRELAMSQFNQFWSRHVSDLKPTQGYPGDSTRFRDQITDAQKTLGISDAVLWRYR